MRTALFLSFLCLLALPGDLRSGWGPSGCFAASGPVGPRVDMGKLPAESAPRYRWVSFDDENFTLYDNGLPIAAYQWTPDLYSPRGGKSGPPPWGSRPTPFQPVVAPVQSSLVPADPFFTPAARPVAVIPNFGVDLAKIGQNTPRYAVNGHPATLAEAKAAVEGNSLRDDSQKLRLTVIGSDSQRQQVIHDMTAHAALTSWKEALVIKDYPADHWAVARTGFVTGGQPTIYLQKPDGTVLHRQDDYAGGAEQLAEALRKADPNYQPAKDPDKRKPALPSLPEVPELPLWLWIGGGGVALLLLARPAAEVLG